MNWNVLNIKSYFKYFLITFALFFNWDISILVFLSFSKMANKQRWPLRLVSSWNLLSEHGCTFVDLFNSSQYAPVPVYHSFGRFSWFCLLVFPCIFNIVMLHVSVCCIGSSSRRLQSSIRAQLCEKAPCINLDIGL